MASNIYESATITLIDNTVLNIGPLKIIFLKDFLEEFKNVKKAVGDEDAITALSRCAVIAMRQYYPSITTVEELEDSVDLPTIYKIIDIAAGIKVDSKSDEPVKKQASESGSSWDDLDLAKLESEVFLLGIWKEYAELESHFSMPELLATLEAKRESDYNDRKFFAAIQGVDLDKETGKQDPWEEMKARVFSGGKATDSNDILSYQGPKAQEAGFGIGMGLQYEDLTKK
jgi:hypothetical protein